MKIGLFFSISSLIWLDWIHRHLSDSFYCWNLIEIVHFWSTQLGSWAQHFPIELFWFSIHPYPKPFECSTFQEVAYWPSSILSNCLWDSITDLQSQPIYARLLLYPWPVTTFQETSLWRHSSSWTPMISSEYHSGLTIFGGHFEVSESCDLVFGNS